MRRARGWSFLLVFLVACSSGVTPPSPNPGDGPSGRIEIVPGSFLLTEAGESFALSATVYDTDGNPVDADVTWHSTDAAVIDVDANGTATAAVAVGSAQVTARAAGLESAPVLGVVATPTEGVVLVSDDMVIADVVPVDASLPYAPGWQYRVGLQNVTLSPGQLVLGTGETPIAGRVVSISETADASTVVIELVALPELFDALRLDAEIPLVEAPAVSPAAVPGDFVRPQSGGLAPTATFKKGKFDCETDGTIPDLDLPDPSLEVTPSLSLDVLYEMGVGLHRLAVIGAIEADFGYKPVFKATFEGNVTCEAVLKTVTIPLNGWFAYFFGVQVPVGLGLKLDGKLDVAEVGFDVSANASATVELGMNCSPPAGGCTGVQSFETERDFDFEFVAPDPDEQFKVELGAHGYVFARPSVGSAFSSSTQFEFIAAEAGLKQTLSLATTIGQVSDPEYASGFALTGPLKIGAGKSLSDAMGKLNDLLGLDLNLNLTLIDRVPTLAESPKGTFTITPATVEPGTDGALGEMATFKIELDPVKYLTLEAVEKVEIFWKKDGENDAFTLEPGRPSCTEITGGGGQKTFECETDFLEEHAGPQTFYAFVHAKLFGVPLPIPLEIAIDARADVDVGGCRPEGPHALPVRYFTTPAELEELRGETRLFAHIIITGDEITTLEPLNELTCIAHQLHIASTGLSTLSGLESLTTIGAGLLVTDNLSLTSLAGLENLSTYTAYQSAAPLSLSNLPSLTTLDALRRLDVDMEVVQTDSGEVGGTLAITHAPMLTTLAGLEGVRGEFGSLNVTLAGLTDFSALDGVTRVQRSLQIGATTVSPTFQLSGDEPALNIVIGGYGGTLAFMSGLTTIRELRLASNTALSPQDLTGLSLAHVDQGGSILNNCCFTDAQATSWAGSVGTNGTWTISGNAE